MKIALSPRSILGVRETKSLPVCADQLCRFVSVKVVLGTMEGDALRLRDELHHSLQSQGFGRCRPMVGHKRICTNDDSWRSVRFEIV